MKVCGYFKWIKIAFLKVFDFGSCVSHHVLPEKDFHITEKTVLPGDCLTLSECIPLKKKRVYVTQQIDL